MKLKYYLIPLLAVSVLMSCSKDDDPGIKEPDMSPDATFSLSVESVKTKAEVTLQPKDRITKLSVILYIGGEYHTMKDSVLPADKINDLKSTINEVVNIPVKSGNVKVLILANAGNSAAFVGKSLAEALAIKTEGLAKEVHSHLTMNSDVMDMTLRASVHNYLGYSKPGAEGINVVSSSPVLLYRNVARIQLTQLTLMRKTDYGTTVKFALKKIYIANAKSHSYLASKDETTGTTNSPNWGTVEVEAEETPAFWWAGVKDNVAGEFDKLTYAYTVENDRLSYEFIVQKRPWTEFVYYDEHSHKGPEGGVLIEFELPVDKEIHNNIQGRPPMAFAVGNFFYTYENLDPLAGEKTMLILKGDYTYIPNGGAEAITVEDTYYSVVVNGNGADNEITGVAEHTGIKRNTKYSLDLTIKGPGSTTPDQSERAYIGAKVKVLDWNAILIEANVD